MESFVAYEVFSARQLIWEQWCVCQREENEYVAQYTREPVMADGGQIVQRQDDELCYYNFSDWYTRSVSYYMKHSYGLKITNQKKTMS